MLLTPVALKWLSLLWVQPSAKTPGDTQRFENPLAIVSNWRHSEVTHIGAELDTSASSRIQDVWLGMSHQWKGSAGDLRQSWPSAEEQQDILLVQL